MKSIFISLLLSASFLTAAFAKKIPATDSLPGCGVSGDFLERNIDPQLLDQMNAAWQTHQQQNKANGRVSADDQVLYVPVMFHIVHLGEAVGAGSNVTEAQVQVGLANLNNAFRARGRLYTGASDTKIEFVLANCSGVDRADASGVTDYLEKGAIFQDYNQNNQIRQLFGGEKQKYINIYVCRAITDAGAFAGYGGDMFVSYTNFSKTGSRYASAYDIIHEMGHCLFLKHTFEGEGEGSVCPANNNPFMDGDEVTDTDPHLKDDLNLFTKSTDINRCTNAPYGINIAKNFMAYFNRSDRFSPGQIERMRFYLQNYLRNWIDSDAIPTPNNQIALTTVPSFVCATSPATVGFTNSSGSVNPAVLFYKGEDVVYYADAIGSMATFTVPQGIFDNPGYFKLPEGNDYKIRAVSGCNKSAFSNPVAFNNIYLYTPSIAGNDGENIPASEIAICPSTSVTLAAKLYYDGEAKTQITSPADYGNFTFQWELYQTNIPGATNGTYPFTGNDGIYTVNVGKASCPQRVRTPIYTEVHHTSYPSSVTGDYNYSSIYMGDYPRIRCSDDSAKLYSRYFSNSATYSWYKDGVLLPEETKRTLNAKNTGRYKVITTDVGCNIEIPPFNGISLQFGNTIENTIKSSKDSVTCDYLHMYGQPPYPGFNYQYQWLRNGIEIPGATEYQYEATTEGLYSMKLKSGNCESISSGKRIYKGDKIQKPILLGADAYHSGFNYQLSVQNSAAESFNLKWFKDNQPVESEFYGGLNISSSGTYKVLKGSGDCANYSDPLVINFDQFIPVPKIFATDTVRLTCNNIVYNPYLYFTTGAIDQELEGATFRWIRDGIELPLSNIYADKPYIYPEQSGQYRIKFIYKDVIQISAPITILSTNNRVTKLVSTNGITACENNTLSLGFQLGIAYNINTITSVIWKRDGNILPTQSGNTLAATQSGTYTATYQGNGCSITTEPLTVTIGGPPPSATLSGQYAIRSGETANLQLSSSTKGPYFFTLSDGAEYIGQTLITPIPQSPTVSTTYTLASFGTHCGPSPNASGQARIDVTNCAIGIINATLSGGIWNTPAIWSCGSIPTVLDDVRIDQMHNVTMPTGYTATAKSLELQGSLQYSSNAWLKMGQE